MNRSVPSKARKGERDKESQLDEVSTKVFSFVLTIHLSFLMGGDCVGDKV